MDNKYFVLVAEQNFILFASYLDSLPRYNVSFILLFELLLWKSETVDWELFSIFKAFQLRSVHNTPSNEA